ncbi:hypothetical protein LTS10_001872 [Elasticomyces elasticus]|nr:hypothetical protein LTS10_001872 [Elasticomyces elasticus]
MSDRPFTTCPVPAGAEEHGVHGTAWMPMVWAALGCTIATTLIGLSLIILNLRRYRAPKEQRQIVRIAFCVNVFAAVSCSAVYNEEVAQYLVPISDLYEAFALCALYLLYVQFAAPDGTYSDDLFATVKSVQEADMDFDWPRIWWICVFQFPIVEAICVVIEVSTEARGRFCPNSMAPWFGNFWVITLQTFGIGICVIAILKFRGVMKVRMKVRRGMAKLMCFKLIVFLNFAQSLTFSLLLQSEVIKPSAVLSYDDILYGIPGLAICGEMVFISLGFWYAFSSTEYSSKAKPNSKPLPLFKAILHALNPWDLLSGVARIFPLFMELHRNGGWKQYRAARFETSTWNKMKKRWQKRRGKGNAQYEEIGEGLEDLRKPTETHRSHSLLAALETAYAPTTEIDGQQMYRPPPGSPPDEARSHLMPLASPRATSPRQLGSLRYNESPPPYGRVGEDPVSRRDMV